jgi:hypothetical protein
MNSWINSGDADFSEGFRNPGAMVGANPNETRTVPERFQKVAEQRGLIIEAFMAEHGGLLPSQIIQVTTPLSNGDIRWHLEVK